MGNVRNFWKKLKYWQKGGVIGFLLFIIYYLIILIVTLIISYRIGNFNCGFFVEHKPCSFSEFFRLNLLILSNWIKNYGIYSIIIGGIIGLIIDTFKRK